MVPMQRSLRCAVLTLRRLDCPSCLNRVLYRMPSPFLFRNENGWMLFTVLTQIRIATLDGLGCPIHLPIPTSLRNLLHPFADQPHKKGAVGQILCAGLVTRSA